MANLFQMDTVKYVCCCGSLKPISFTYFCRHCLRLRCHYCVSHEVDSHFCSNCSENMPSAEAKLRKNRCATCYDCPSCRQTLSIRATTIQTDPDDSNPKKSYYLACGVCRWSSREAGMEDASTSAGPWKEPEHPEATEIEKLAEYYRMLGVREKSAKEKKYVHKSKYLAAGRHGVAHLLPKRVSLSNPDEMEKPVEPPPYTAPTLGIEDFPELPDEFYEEELIVPTVTPIAHRLQQVETQPRSYSEFLPMHKHLMVKRSLRCRVCERNISKPEYSPASIKFKIQLNAYYHVPQIRLAAPFTDAGIEPGKKAKIQLKLSNPTQFPTTLKFLPFSFVRLRKEDVVGEGELPSLGSASAPRDSSLDSISLAFTPQTQMIKEISVLPFRDDKFTINFKLDQPSHELVLPPKDETSDFDDFSETPDYNDDPNFVTWRKGNKATVCLEIEKDKEAWNPEDPPLLGLSIEYDYTNTIMPLDSKGDTSPQKVRIQAHLLIALDRKQL